MTKFVVFTLAKERQPRGYGTDPVRPVSVESRVAPSREADLSDLLLDLFDDLELRRFAVRVEPELDANVTWSAARTHVADEVVKALQRRGRALKKFQPGISQRTRVPVRPRVHA